MNIIWLISIVDQYTIDGAPYDGYPQDVFHSNHLALIIVYSFLSFMGLLFSITCLIFNIIFKNHRLVSIKTYNLTK